MCKKCCKLKDLKQHYNEKMAEEGNSWFGRMCFRFEYFSGSFAFLSAVVTTLAILYQYIVIQRMTLTDANPYPMWLEGTCTCNGALCPGVVWGKMNKFGWVFMVTAALLLAEATTNVVCEVTIFRLR